MLLPMILKVMPALALCGRWTLDFKKSKCFLRGPETLMETKNYNGNLFTNVIIIYLSILLCPD